MTNYSWSKLYFQLAPAAGARSYVTDAVSKLTDNTFDELQLSDSDRWHVTVIHVGNLQPIWQQLRAGGCAVGFEQFIAAMSDWAQEQQQLVAGAEYTLTATGFQRFGGQASVLAVALKPDNRLVADHQQAYQRLVNVWTSLGINQPAMTMRSLPELKFAHKLNPHVSVARGVNLNITPPTLGRSELVFKPMKFFYELHE